jgi:type IX secretion system PorP/SprF family membrane protein
MLNKIPIHILFCAILLISLWGGSLSAQQEPQFTQNMFNLSSVNPGHFGMTEGICVTGLLREQWLGFKDDNGNKVSPETFVVSADAPIRFLHGGVGLSIVQDKYGFFKDMTLKLGYAYHTTKGATKMGFGVNGSFLNKSVDFGDNLQVVNPDDPAISGFTSSEGVILTDISAGFYMQAPKYYLSASSTQLLETSKFLSKTGQTGQFKLRRHYYLTGGYDLTFPAYPGYVLTPSLYLKSDGNTMQADVNALVTYNKKIWGGASYRINDAFALMVGFKFNDIDVGYSYDVPTSRVGATGSHEIMVRYIFKIEKEKVRTGYRNTRFL